MAEVFQNILSFDTAMAGVYVAYADGDVVASRTRAQPHGQAEHLIPMIEEALAEASGAFADVEAIVTTFGPGAFTGLRIGLSAAKALAMSLDVPLYGVSTLDAIAGQFVAQGQGEAFTVVLETKRADFYTQSFDAKGNAVSEPVAAEAQDIEQNGQVFIGDAVERYQEAIGADVQYIRGYERVDPEFMIAMMKDGCDALSREVEPLYLRGADVSQPKKKPRVLAGN